MNWMEMYPQLHSHSVPSSHLPVLWQDLGPLAFSRSHCWALRRMEVVDGRQHYSIREHIWLAKELKSHMVPQKIVSNTTKKRCCTIYFLLRNSNSKQLPLCKKFRWLTDIYIASTNSVWLLFTTGNLYLPPPPLKSQLVLG